MKRLWLMIVGASLLVTMLGISALQFTQNTGRTPVSDGSINPDSIPVLAKSIDLVLQRSYMCGQQDEEHKKLESDSIEDLLAEYSGWEIISIGPDKVVLHQQVNDLSPLCKENGYFGLTEDGTLTLFNGLPAEQKVIQTFYRIDTERMEASIPAAEIDLLRSGIRVGNLAEFNSILSTYGEFQAGSSMNRPGH